MSANLGELKLEELILVLVQPFPVYDCYALWIEIERKNYTCM